MKKVQKSLGLIHFFGEEQNVTLLGNGPQIDVYRHKTHFGPPDFQPLDY
jgi:hypothetical protein